VATIAVVRQATGIADNERASSPERMPVQESSDSKPDRRRHRQQRFRRVAATRMARIARSPPPVVLSTSR